MSPRFKHLTAPTTISVKEGPRADTLRERGYEELADDEEAVASRQSLGPGAEQAPEPPAQSAKKAEWVAYAEAADPAVDAGELTKDELIERYG